MFFSILILHFISLILK